MHTPIEVTERGDANRARLRADCIVSVGGVDTGLGKAIALRTDLPAYRAADQLRRLGITPVVARPRRDQDHRIEPENFPEIVIY